MCSVPDAPKGPPPPPPPIKPPKLELAESGAPEQRRRNPRTDVAPAPGLGGMAPGSTGLGIV
jgi:hypothetical protein